MKAKLFAALVFLVSTPLLAWDGWDYESGTRVEIEKGTLVREGLDIDFYEYGGNGSGYQSGSVESIRSTSRGVEIEIYDNSTGELRTFEMEDRR